MISRVNQKAALGKRQATPVDAFDVARRWFTAGEKMDMTALAAAMGVDRTTLFRWVGNRNQLLSAILVSMLEGTFHSVCSKLDARGGARIAAIVEGISEAIVDSRALRQFLDREPEYALRLLTAQSPAQKRGIELVKSAIEEEVKAGHLNPPLPVSDLAYLVVRIAESFMYTDLITGEKPSPRNAGKAVAALLRSDSAPTVPRVSANKANTARTRPRTQHA